MDVIALMKQLLEATLLRRVSIGAESRHEFVVAKQRVASMLTLPAQEIASPDGRAITAFPYGPKMP